MTTWQPIDTAPKDGTAVLIWDGSDMVVAICEPNLLIPWRSTYGDTIGEPTHWMPLPAPPEADER